MCRAALCRCEPGRWRGGWVGHPAAAGLPALTSPRRLRLGVQDPTIPTDRATLVEHVHQVRARGRAGARGVPAGCTPCLLCILRRVMRLRFFIPAAAPPLPHPSAPCPTPAPSRQCLMYGRLLSGRLTEYHTRQTAHEQVFKCVQETVRARTGPATWRAPGVDSQWGLPPPAPCGRLLARGIAGTRAGARAGRPPYPGRELTTPRC